AGSDDRGIKPIALTLADELVIADKTGPGPNNPETFVLQLADFLVTILAKPGNLGILPANDLGQVVVRLLRLDLEPAMLFRVVHRVDRLEDRLRRHATRIDAKRCV